MQRSWGDKERMNVSAARPLPLIVKAQAPAAKPVAKTSDTVAHVGQAVMDISLLALVGGFIASAFIPAGARVFTLAANIAMGVGGAGLLTTFGLGKWLEKLESEGR
ncbi:MAG: hypothetical protein JWM80_1729 [Cyanobacteria bacterium RYN_339]|nr:hypothetical protein [Cyanobacteria bacterium RYN_339]